MTSQYRKKFDCRHATNEQVSFIAGLMRKAPKGKLSFEDVKEYAKRYPPHIYGGVPSKNDLVTVYDLNFRREILQSNANSKPPQQAPGPLIASHTETPLLPLQNDYLAMMQQGNLGSSSGQTYSNQIGGMDLMSDLSNLAGSNMILDPLQSQEHHFNTISHPYNYPSSTHTHYDYGVESSCHIMPPQRPLQILQQPSKRYPRSPLVRAARRKRSVEFEEALKHVSNKRHEPFFTGSLHQVEASKINPNQMNQLSEPTSSSRSLNTISTYKSSASYHPSRRQLLRSPELQPSSYSPNPAKVLDFRKYVESTDGDLGTVSQPENYTSSERHAIEDQTHKSPDLGWQPNEEFMNLIAMINEHPNERAVVTTTKQNEMGQLYDEQVLDPLLMQQDHSTNTTATILNSSDEKYQSAEELSMLLPLLTEPFSAAALPDGLWKDVDKAIKEEDARIATEQGVTSMASNQLPEVLQQETTHESSGDTEQLPYRSKEENVLAREQAQSACVVINDASAGAEDQFRFENYGEVSQELWDNFLWNT